MKLWINAGFYVLVMGLILFNLVILRHRSKVPLAFLQLEKPALVVLLDEHECQKCIEDLEVLNNAFERIEENGVITLQGIILSKKGVDSKGIASSFLFPTSISEDFGVLERLNMDKTPLLIGLTQEHRIAYVEYLHNSALLTEDHLDKVLEHLYGVYFAH